MIERTTKPKPSAGVMTLVRSGVLQRKCACGGTCGPSGECEACRRKRLQRKVAQPLTLTHQQSEVPPIVHEVLRSPGQPLDSATRAFMEPRFGHDFSQVRVHANAQAAESVRAVNALAYTVGREVVFGAGHYQPQANSGKQLLAHELTHVVQQGSAINSPGQLMIGPADDPLEQEADLAATQLGQGAVAAAARIGTVSSVRRLQRDLATPPPAIAAPAQPNLTPAQIQEAIRFNQARYNEANTRLIQRLLGGPQTGTWTEENIEAIANTQQEYGLNKDGKVGDATFRFLNGEEGLEGLTTSNENCLLSFRLVGPDAQNFGRDDPTHCHFGNHFRIEAQFSPRCNCDHFEYRQFIRGHWRRTRGGVVTDLPIREPGGVLPAAFIEDTDTADPVPHYGHRADPAGALVEDHYIDATGADDQAHGCRYRAEDFPGFRPFGDCLAGDRYDLFTTFRGEIQRSGSAIQQKAWTAINISNWRP